MKWAEFCVHTVQEAVEAISNLLHENGAAGVLIEDPRDLVTEWSVKYGEVYELSPEDYPDEGVRVKAYFPMNADFVETIDAVKKRVLALPDLQIDIGRADMNYVEVDEADWANAWKKYYHPVRITDRIVIVPTWEKYEAQQDEMVIELDPGMAFGTGTHPTTVLSIQALESVVKRNDTVIDVGTGSGILALAAWKLGAKTITAFDLDDVAVNSARENFRLNDAEHKIQVQQNHLLNGVSASSADVVVANILAEVIIPFTPDAFHVLKPGGMFLTSGIIEKKEEQVCHSLTQAGFTIEQISRQDDWIAIKARKANS